MLARKPVMALVVLFTAACADQGQQPPSSSTRSPIKQPSLVTEVQWPEGDPAMVQAVVDARTIQLADGAVVRISSLAPPAPCWAGSALDFATTTLLRQTVRVANNGPGEVVLHLEDGTNYALLAVTRGVLRAEGLTGPLSDAEMTAARENRGLWGSPCNGMDAAPPPPPGSNVSNAQFVPGAPDAPAPQLPQPPQPPVPPPNGGPVTTGPAPAPPKPAPTTTPPAPKPPQPPAPAPERTCAVAYRITSQWPGGFQASVTLRNTGRTTINGWTLRWTFGDGQAVTQMWNAVSSQSGGSVSAGNASYNPSIAPGGTVSIGFNGTPGRGANTAPRSFTLNGTACAAE